MSESVKVTGEIGRALLEARKKKGAKDKDLCARLKVSSEALRALEEERFEAFSGDIYAKGFLKKYAEAVGLDPAPLLAEYDRRRPQVQQPSGFFAPSSQPRSAGLEEKPERLSLLGRPFLLVAAAVAGLILVAAAGVAIVRLAAKAGAAPSAGARAVAKAAARPALVVPKGTVLDLSVFCRDDVWIRASADGKLLWQQVLKKGALERLKAVQRIELSVGRPEALVLTLNGKPIAVPRLGRKLRITHEGVQAL